MGVHHWGRIVGWQIDIERNFQGDIIFLTIGIWYLHNNENAYQINIESNDIPNKIPVYSITGEGTLHTPLFLLSTDSYKYTTKDHTRWEHQNKNWFGQCVRYVSSESCRTYHWAMTKASPLLRGHCFKWWLGIEQATNHYLDQIENNSLTHMHIYHMRHSASLSQIYISNIYGRGIVLSIGILCKCHCIIFDTENVWLVLYRILIIDHLSSFVRYQTRQAVWGWGFFKFWNIAKWCFYFVIIKRISTLAALKILNNVFHWQV